MRRLCLLILMCFCMHAFAAPLTKLTGLQIKAKPEFSSFIFNLNQKTYGRVKYLKAENKLIIEFANTTMHFNLPPTQLNDSNVDTISVKKTKDKKLQFVFELKQAVKWKVYFLPKKNYAAELKLEIITPMPPPIRKNELAKLFNEDVVNAYEKISSDNVKEINKKPAIFTIVIDAGHGGKDSGAIGKNGVQEKRIVLAIAKNLAKKINQTTHMRAVLTRDGDYFVPLRKRLQLARKGEADIFIAIHADAYFNDLSTGASVYALSKRGATTEAARWLAQRDNYSEIGDVDLNNLKDNSLILRSVLIDLAQTYTIQDSLRLGNKVLDALDELSPLHYKNVQQAPFVVLKSPDIPSILIETGFITNPREEKRLITDAYQEALVNAIYAGINHYYEAYGRHL